MLKCLENKAKKGNRNAAFKLGDMYLLGEEGVEEDIEKAVEYYILSSDLGNTDAMCVLGDIYLDGGMGIEKDTRRGIKYYERAARKGDISAMKSLERCYSEGYREGGDLGKDFKKEMEWRNLRYKLTNALIRRKMSLKYRQTIKVAAGLVAIEFFIILFLLEEIILY